MISAQQIVVKWLEYAASGAVLLLAARLAVARLRQPADRIRLILMAFVAASLIAPLVSLAPLPAWHLGIIGSTPLDTASSAPSVEQQAVPVGWALPTAEFRVGDAQPASAVPTKIASAPPADETPRPMRFDRWRVAATALLAANGLAIALLTVEWLIGRRLLRRLLARAQRASAELEQLWLTISEGRGGKVRLLVSSEVSTPLAFGILRPTVMVPEPLAAGDRAALRFALGHEWSHIDSGDLQGWRLAWICQFALWFQPLFWVLRRELRACQDFVADNRASAAGRERIEYSELLLKLARGRVCRPIPAAIAFLDRSSQLSRRIKMLLASPLALRSRSPRAFCLAAGILSLASALLLGAVRLESLQAGDETQPKGGQRDDASAAKEPQPPAPAKADPGETLSYTAVVLDKHTGQGIAGATVIVRRSKLTSQENTILEETRHTTDAEGKYSFTIPPEQVAVSALYIELDVEHNDYAARKGFGYALSMIRKNEALGERPFFEKTELQPSDPITGTVVDPDGKPLAGVKVHGYSKANATDLRDYGSFTDAVTDEAGKFRLNLVKGGVGVFWVLPTDYASSSHAVNKERGDVGEIRLRAGVRLSGRLVSAEGQPVPNIPVNIRYLGGGNETVNNLPVATSICRSFLTDNDGHFAFDPLPSGEYRVIPEDHRFDPILRDRTRYDLPGVFLPLKVKLREGVACSPIEIQASPHIIFNAQIFDSKGAKRGGHEVMMFGRLDGQHWLAQGRPNPEGTIAMRVPHGLQNVQLDMPINEHQSIRFRRGTGKELENQRFRVDLGTLNDDVNGFEIIYYRAPIVLVGAVNADGTPIKDFRVTAAYPWGKQTYVLAGELRSDLNFERQDDGRYRTSQMLPDEDVKFTITAPGYETAGETVRLGEGETKELSLTLKKSVETTKE